MLPVESVKTLELKEHDLRVKVSWHQGFIWRAHENKRNDEMCCISLRLTGEVGMGASVDTDDIKLE